MKKVFSLLLALTMVFALCACDGAEQLEQIKNVDLPPLPTVAPEETAEPTPGPEETAEPEETVSIPDPEKPVMLRFDRDQIEQYDPDEGTQLILSYRCDKPTVYIEGNPDAASLINESVARLNETFYTGDDYGGIYTEGIPSGFYGMLEAAEDNFAYVRSVEFELPLEFSYTRTGRTCRLDDRVLSLILTDYTYTGGAHGNYQDLAYNYSTVTGQQLRLDQITSDFDAFKDYLTKGMVEKVRSGEVYVDEDYLMDKDLETALGELVREGTWYFDSKGLVLFSNIYELGPYAQGVISFPFSYEELGERILPEYLPGERGGEGTLSVASLSELSEGTTILDRIDVDQDGEDYALKVEGRIYDVSVSTAYYMDYLSKFAEHEQLWHCNCLTDCAVQIHTVIPEGLPSLMIRYRDGAGEEHVKMLSQSGADGSVSLVDDTVEAVG